jgi:hypothetical protein
MRASLTAVVCITLLALLVQGAGARSGAAPGEDFVNVEFWGTATADFERTVHDVANTSYHESDHITYGWRETSVVPITNVTTPVIGEAKDLITGSGTMTVSSSANSCTSPITEFASTDGRFAVSESGVRVNRVQGAGAPGVTGVEVTGKMPIDYYTIKGCNGYLNGSMSNGPVNSLAEDSPFSCVLHPNKECRDTISKSGSVPIPEGSYTFSVTGSFHAWRTTAEPLPETPQLSKAKVDASQDFSNIIFGRTWAYCYPRMIESYPEGVPFGSGGPKVVTFEGAPWVEAICGDLIQRMADAFDIWQDPPRADYRALATVRNARATPLATAGEKELTAERHVTAVLAAIKTTVAREAGAKKAGSRSAVALQEHQLSKLEAQLVQARTADEKAAAAVAAQLRAKKVSGPIPPGVFDKGFAVVIERLAGVGVSKADIAAIVPGKPLIPPDVTVALGGPVPKVAAVSAGGTTPTPSTQPATTPTISSVAFSGNPGNPSVIIHGKNFGKRPAPNPSAHPSGQPSGSGRCPVVAGDTGYNYGTSLYLAATAKNWSGGRYRPELGENDCLDLVVTKFTPTEVAFHFGPFYTKFHSNFSLDSGDAVEVDVNGAVLDVHVKYGASVSS